MREDVKEAIEDLREHALEMVNFDWAHLTKRAHDGDIGAGQVAAQLARDVAQGFKLIAKALEGIGHDQ